LSASKRHLNDSTCPPPCPAPSPLKASLERVEAHHQLLQLGLQPSAKQLRRGLGTLPKPTTRGPKPAARKEEALRLYILRAKTCPSGTLTHSLSKKTSNLNLNHTPQLKHKPQHSTAPTWHSTAPTWHSTAPTWRTNARPHQGTPQHLAPGIPFSPHAFPFLLPCDHAALLPSRINRTLSRQLLTAADERRLNGRLAAISPQNVCTT